MTEAEPTAIMVWSRRKLMDGQCRVLDSDIVWAVISSIWVEEWGEQGNLLLNRDGVIPYRVQSRLRRWTDRLVRTSDLVVVDFMDE